MRSVLALLATVAPLGAASGVQGAAPLRYELRPIPRDDRTELEVTLSMLSGPTTIGLPEDAYGTPELWRWVTDVEGLEGTVVGEGAGPAERTLTPSSDGEVRVRYTLSYDPAALERYAFAPSVGPAHFDVAGCQWLLRIGDPGQARSLSVRLVDLPEGWACFASLAADARELEVRASYDELVSSRIGAGAFARGRFEHDGQELSVFVTPALDLPAEEVVDAVHRIVELQRARMGGGEPFFRVVVHAREGLLAGTAVPNLFVCFVQPEATRAELFGLLAHEMFHAWLPNRLRLAPPPGDSEIRHEWLSEGVADYAARRLLLDAGSIDADEFAETVNEDLRNLADNPAGGVPYGELRRVAAAGGWDTAHKKLAYDRGALMALGWETVLRAHPGSGDVVALLRCACDEADARGGELTEERFFELAAERGLDAAGDFARHVLAGEPVVPDPGALGDGFELVSVDVPCFDPGFDLRATFRRREVTGVRPGGPAEAAGVANGMGYSSIRNSNRFGNAWRADRPLELTVTSDGGERTFAFFPHGESMSVPQFRRRRAGNPVIEGWYADPEAAVLDGRYWIFPTTSAPYDEQLAFDAFSSTDLVTWTKHEGVLDVGAIAWATRALWAPSVLEKDGRYYLFFAANDLQRPGGPLWDPEDERSHTGGIGVAAADAPQGPYRDLLGAPLVADFHHGAQPIDPFVFRDVDGACYLFYGGWGHCNVARLDDALTGFLPWPDGSTFREVTPEGYVEGPVLFRREGRCYFLWSEGSWGDGSYRVAWATAPSPAGPFERRGTILEEDAAIATGAGHASVLRIPGSDEWYIVYHRRPIPNEGRDHRVTCIDRLEFDADGAIPPVRMTLEGVAARPLR